MSTFETKLASTPIIPADPTKHVNFTLGMLLGADDFIQEFTYLSARDQSLARELHGYGTVCGLAIRQDVDSSGPRILVEPGTALTPLGQIVRVTDAQCAYLNEWLKAQRAVFLAGAAPPPDLLSVYVVLKYRECPTDPIFIPGEPCRDESETVVSSRRADDFELLITREKPDQTEVAALRAFVAWLRALEITDSEPFTTLQEFDTAVRNAFSQFGLPDDPFPQPPGLKPKDPSPSGPTPPLPTPRSGSIPAGPISSRPIPSGPQPIGSPPNIAPVKLRVPQDNLCEYLDLAFRLWVTELRPQKLGKGQTCAGQPPQENGVMLAKLQLPLIRPDEDWQIDAVRPTELDESERPYVLHTQMLQEYLICGSDDRANHTIEGDVTGTLAATSVDRIRGTEVSPDAPSASDILQFVGDQWQPVDPQTVLGQPSGDPGQMRTPADTVVEEKTFGAAAAPGTAAEYSRADHTHGAPPDPVPGHIADVGAHNNHAVAGDVSGTVGAATVTHIQGTPVSTTAPTPNLPYLKFDGARWSPAALRYEVVAAAFVSFRFFDNPPTFIIAKAYNDLRVVNMIPASSQIKFSFNGYNQTTPFPYIVKALPGPGTPPPVPPVPPIIPPVPPIIPPGPISPRPGPISPRPGPISPQPGPISPIPGRITPRFGLTTPMSITEEFPFFAMYRGAEKSGFWLRMFRADGKEESFAGNLMIEVSQIL